jgi:hypothetical protein
VLGGDEVGSGRSKNAYVFDFLFGFGRLAGDTGWFNVWNGPPRPLNMPSHKLAAVGMSHVGMAWHAVVVAACGVPRACPPNPQTTPLVGGRGRGH